MSDFKKLHNVMKNVETLKRSMTQAGMNNHKSPDEIMRDAALKHAKKVYEMGACVIINNELVWSLKKGVSSDNH